jgi:hypothetical protein
LNQWPSSGFVAGQKLLRMCVHLPFMGLMEKPQCLLLLGGTMLEEYYGDNTNGNKDDKKMAGNIQGARLGIHGAGHQRAGRRSKKPVSITKRSNKLTQLGVRRAKTSPQQRCSSI